MDSRILDIAAEFCDLAGKPNLLDYLGLPEDASPAIAQKKLKARRKYMQGMQSNPKYRAEAIFLIKNFTSLSQVLETPIPYLKDASRRAESQHLPILEMTIRSALAGGTLNDDQEEYLRRNALELGVSEPTFEETLHRLCDDAGIVLQARPSTEPPNHPNEDLYGLLGVARHASRDDIYAQYRTKTEECASLSDTRQRNALRQRLERAWKVLSSDEERKRYDLSWTRTGPPARNREVVRPKQVSTAPPIQTRNDNDEPTAPAKLEVLSEKRQQFRLRGVPVTLSIEIRNAGEDALRGSVHADKPWLKVLTPTLKPDQRQQSVRIQITPSKLTTRTATGTVQIVSENGQTETIVLDVSSGTPSFAIPIAIGAGVATVMLLFVGVLFWGQDTTHVLEIDPWAEEVLIDGKVVGRGTERVVLDNPPDSRATITVRHKNFKPYVKDIDLREGESTRVELSLSVPMTFVADPSLRRARLDEGLVGEIMSAFRPKLDRCLRAGITNEQSLHGVLRIHVAKDGHTQGISLTGDGSDSPAILACLRRQAAGPVFPPLDGGDFATVRYDYVIPGR